MKKILINIFATLLVVNFGFFVYEILTNDNRYTIIKETKTIEKKGRGFYYREESFHVDYLASGAEHDEKLKWECKKTTFGDICIKSQFDFEKNEWITIEEVKR